MEAPELVVYSISVNSELQQQKLLTLFHFELVCPNTIFDALLLMN